MLRTSADVNPWHTQKKKWARHCVSRCSSRVDRNVKRHVPVSVDFNFSSRTVIACSSFTRYARSPLSLPKVRSEEVSCFAHFVFLSFPSPSLRSYHSLPRLSDRLSPSARLLPRLARKRPAPRSPRRRRCRNKHSCGRGEWCQARARPCTGDRCAWDGIRFRYCCRKIDR